jgi:hypothetical protein
MALLPEGHDTLDFPFFSRIGFILYLSLRSCEGFMKGLLETNSSIESIMPAIALEQAITYLLSAGLVYLLVQRLFTKRDASSSDFRSILFVHHVVSVAASLWTFGRMNSGGRVYTGLRICLDMFFALVEGSGLITPILGNVISTSRNVDI